MGPRTRQTGSQTFGTCTGMGGTLVKGMRIVAKLNSLSEARSGQEDMMGVPDQAVQRYGHPSRRTRGWSSFGATTNNRGGRNSI